MCVLLIMIYLKTLCLPFFVLYFLSIEGPREGFDLQTVLNGRLYFLLQYRDFSFQFQSLGNFLCLIPRVPTCSWPPPCPTRVGIRTGVAALSGSVSNITVTYLARPEFVFLVQ